MTHIETFAQSMVEYGAVASMAAGLERLAYTVRTWVTTLSPTSWAVVGAIVFLVLIAGRRRTPRF